MCEEEKAEFVVKKRKRCDVCFGYANLEYDCPRCNGTGYLYEDVLLEEALEYLERSKE